jgi:hypothetical protein
VSRLKQKPPVATTTEDVRVGVSLVAALAEDKDDEAAHAAEDALHQSVLKAIADGAKAPADLAKAALKTKNIKFSRWCS